MTKLLLTGYSNSQPVLSKEVTTSTEARRLGDRAKSQGQCEAYTISKVFESHGFSAKGESHV